MIKAKAKAKQKGAAVPKATKTPKSEIFLTKNDFEDIRLTQSQQDFYNTLKDNTIIAAYGPAGTSKTFTTCYFALQQLCAGKIDRIILSKPIQEAGDEHLGFLPGDQDAKTAVYEESYWHNIGKIIPEFNISLLRDNNKICFKPLAYMRGITYDNAIIICDEAQNANMRLLMLVITRLGKNSKIILTGDVSQHDIKSNLVALPKLIDIIEDVESVGFHEFTTDDVVRHPLLIKITEKYENWKYSEEGMKSGLIL